MLFSLSPSGQYSRIEEVIIPLVNVLWLLSKDVRKIVIRKWFDLHTRRIGNELMQFKITEIFPKKKKKKTDGFTGHLTLKV